MGWQEAATRSAAPKGWMGGVQRSKVRTCIGAGKLNKQIGAQGPKVARNEPKGLGRAGRMEGAQPFGGRRFCMAAAPSATGPCSLPAAAPERASGLGNGHVEWQQARGGWGGRGGGTRIGSCKGWDPRGEMPAGWESELAACRGGGPSAGMGRRVWQGVAGWGRQAVHACAAARRRGGMHPHRGLEGGRAVRGGASVSRV